MKDSVIIQAVSIDDLRLMVKEVVSEVISDMIPKPPTQPPEYLTRQQACDILQVSKVTLSKWSKSGILKAYRISSRVRYKQSEIEEALQEIRTIKYRRTAT